ncbi:MAG TPA: CHAD domain-containing protein [Rhizomicrobium sp.]|nr:CHAD domain-containing protein [Rhizomicrobium sp.]
MDESRSATIRTVGRSSRDAHALAVNARPLRISKAMSLEDAFRVTLLECLAHVAANVAAVTRSREVEGLHQLRVALRRLAVAFQAFGEDFLDPAQRELLERAKAFGAAIAPARDLDVFAEELFAPAAEALGGEAGFSLLRARLERARVEAWERAVERVSSADFAVFLDDVAVAAQSRAWTASGGVDAKSRMAIRAPVKPAAAKMLDEFLIKARKRGRRLKELEPRDCHRLRIALKKLRYAAEFYGPLFKKKKVKSYLGKLKGLQDLLGALNDAGHVRATLAQLTAGGAHGEGAQADLFFAAGHINGWHSARAARLGRESLKDWDKFKRAEPFWV